MEVWALDRPSAVTGRGHAGDLKRLMESLDKDIFREVHLTAAENETA